MVWATLVVAHLNDRQGVFVLPETPDCAIVRRMFQRVAAIWLLAAFFWIWPTRPLWAAPPDGASRFWPIVDTTHDRISRTILSSAEWFDAFFLDERHENEINETRLKISFESSAVNGEGMNFDARTSLNVVLPEMEERLSFEISGNTSDYKTDVPLADENLKDTAEDEEKRGGVTAGFRYLLAATDRLNIDLKTGARIRSFQPVVYAGPRYRHTIDFNVWTLRFTQRLRWYSDEGWESRSRLDMERDGFFGDNFFRTTSEIKWFESENGLFYDLDFNFSRAINARTAIEFQWQNRFKTHPHRQLANTAFHLRFRRRILRDWISVEITPQIAYPRSQNYNFTPGIFFKFNVVFGFYSKTGFY